MDAIGALSPNVAGLMHQKCHGEGGYEKDEWRGGGTKVIMGEPYLIKYEGDHISYNEHDLSLIMFLEQVHRL